MSKALQPHTLDSWQWQKQFPYSQTVSVGDQVFISGQQTLDSNGKVCNPGDIAAQTRNVFENIKKRLEDLGMELGDLVRLNTYYVFEGDDEDATQYWEDMTRVRLEYFPDPGPAATAVRAKGMPYEGQLIQIEGVALRGDSRVNRKRIMPSGSWDWSIAVPLSQGWKFGNRIYVGGQISADKKGHSVHVGDLEAQTRNIYQYIETVLTEAESSFSDVVHIKICFKYDSTDPNSGQSFADRIMEITKDYINGKPPVVTAFAVGLLYPGLDLEIDAVAIIDENRKVINKNDIGGNYQPAEFSDGVVAQGEIYVAGQTALAEDGSVEHENDIAGQARITFGRLQSILAEVNASLDDIVKLNLFLVGNGQDIEDEFHQVSQVWSEICPNGNPAMTPVRVHELARPGLLFQADCIALQ